MKALKILENVMTVILAAAVILVAGIYYVPKMFGYDPKAVVSGSMVLAGVSDSDRQYYKEECGIENLHGYDVGCLVYVHQTDFDDIKNGDAITYRLSDDFIVTHMVVDINPEAQTFTTHGIANARNLNEADIPYSSVLGKASDFSIPLAGYVLDWASSAAAKILLITYIVVYIIVMVTNNLIGKASDDNDDDDEKQNNPME